MMPRFCSAWHSTQRCDAAGTMMWGGTRPASSRLRATSMRCTNSSEPRKVAPSAPMTRRLVSSVIGSSLVGHDGFPDREPDDGEGTGDADEDARLRKSRAATNDGVDE